MPYNYCIGCGVLLSPNVYQCPICEYDNSLGNFNDTSQNGDFLSDFDDTFDPDEESAINL